MNESHTRFDTLPHVNPRDCSSGGLKVPGELALTAVPDVGTKEVCLTSEPGLFESDEAFVSQKNRTMKWSRWLRDLASLPTPASKEEGKAHTLLGLPWFKTMIKLM